MATQTLEFNATSGLTITAKLFALESDTVVASVTATEKTNDKGRFVAAFTDIAAGDYRLNGFIGAVGGFVNELYTLTLATDTFLPHSEQLSKLADIQSRIPAALVSGRMDASVGAMAANTMTASALATDAVTEIQSGLATAANLAIVVGYLDTEIAAILADTNELQTDWSNGGRLDNILDARASQISVDTIDDFLDTEVAAIKVATDRFLTMIVLDDAIYQYTANALELTPTGGGGGGDATLANQELIINKLEAMRGPGNDTVEFEINDSTGTAIPHCSCWITTDLAGENVITDIWETDEHGRVSFLLDPGTYYLFRQKNGYTLANPKVFTHA